MTLGDQIRDYWAGTKDDNDSDLFLATIADDRYCDYVAAQFLEYAHNTPGIEIPDEPEDATEEQQEAYDQQIAEAVGGVADAFVLFLAKNRDVPWLIAKLTEYQAEQEKLATQG